MTALMEPGWCQRWRDRDHSWRHVADGGFDRRRYDWAPIAETDSRAFVERHHYSGSYPAAQRQLGMYEGDELVGVAVLGVPVRPEVLSNPFPDLTPYSESTELSRFVLLDRVPANAETWFLARLFGHLRAETEVRAVLAFSDPEPRQVGERLVMPGHWGTIYQASSARYLGRARARYLTVLPDGTVLNDRARAKLAGTERGHRYVVDRLVALGATAPTAAGAPGLAWLGVALGEVGATRTRHGGNHRYAFPLARSVRLGMTPSPYPKRDAA